MVCVLGASTATVLGPSLGGLFGAPAATVTPTKTFVPTFTATPSVQASATFASEPTSTPEPTTPPEPPTPTQPPSPTVGPPTSTPKPPPPAPTPTPRPPAPTNTPQPVYEYELVQEAQRDPCDEGTCVPAVKGEVQNADGSPVAPYAVTIKLNSSVFGVEYCAVGDESKMLQPGQFKFETPGGALFGEYTLTVVANDRSTPLSQTYQLGMVAIKKANQWGIVFRHK